MNIQTPSKNDFFQLGRNATGLRRWAAMMILTGLCLFVGGTLLAEVRAYPVPWVAKESGPYIVFTDLPGAGSIQILTVSGEEVANINIPSGTNQIQWPVVNGSGKKLASGVYFYLITGSGTETTGKLVVIR